MKPRTPAEQQMEELRRLRDALSKRKPAAIAKPKAATPAAPGARGTRSGGTTALGGLEISEVSGAKKAGPSLALSPALYRQVLERQRQTRAFKRRKDMGNWAAELLLALPFNAHKLSPEAKVDLFRRMQEWAHARGLQ